MWSDPYVLIVSESIMSTIFDDKKDEDGFLYVNYGGENTLGIQFLL